MRHLRLFVYQSKSPSEMSNLDINNSLHSVDASPSSTPTTFRRLNRPIGLKLTNSINSTNKKGTTNDDLKSLFAEKGGPSNSSPAIEIKQEDLSVMGLLGMGAGILVNLSTGGSVVKVLHNPSGMILARKTISGAFGDQNEEDKIRKNMIREVQLMKTCKSPYIVSFYGGHFSDGDVVLLMEYLDLGSLDSIYKKMGCIEQDVAGSIIVSVLRGLDYLWTEKRVVHRDIKPSNILVNSRGEVKIGDFGVSKNDNSSTHGGTFTGTQAYLAPERITNIGKITVAADIWALGLSIIEICTGKPPYSDLNMSNCGIMDLFEIIINEPSPCLPSSFDSDISEFVSICLAKDPSDRLTPSQLLNSNLAKKVVLREKEHSLTKWAMTVFHLMNAN